MLAEPKVNVLCCETKTNQFQSFSFAFLACPPSYREPPQACDAVKRLGQNLAKSPRNFSRLSPFSSPLVLLAFDLSRPRSFRSRLVQSFVLPSSFLSSFRLSVKQKFFPLPFHLQMATTNPGSAPAKAPFGKPKSYPFWLGGKLSFTHLSPARILIFFCSFLLNRCRG